MTSGIIEILKGNTAVQQLVKLNEEGTKYKIYPTVCPQPEKQPYIVVQKTSNDTVSMGKDCMSLLDHPRYDVICYAINFRDTEKMAEAVRTALDNASATTTVCQFLRVWLVTEREAWDNGLEQHAHILTFDAEQMRPVS